MTTLFEEVSYVCCEWNFIWQWLLVSKFFGLPFQLDTAEGVVLICE